MSHYVIIVAGGTGRRMNSNIPKQYIEIKGKPVIFHTIEKFLAFDASIHFIIALQKDYQDFFESFYKQEKYSFKYTISLSGKERFYTVNNALQYVNNKSIVGIHDAVRPFVSIETLKRCVKGLEDNLAIVPVTDMIPSIRQIVNDRNIAVDRSCFKVVQTPQYFISDKIKEAYITHYSSKFTDDASVFEDQIGKVYLVEGNEENIKITTPKDLILANHYIK